MSLGDIAAAFAQPASNTDLVGVYVPGGELGAGRPDVELFGALYREPPGCRVIVRGESGAGKTSLILRVIADGAKLAENRSEPLRLAVGDTGMIESATAFLQSVLGAIASQDGRFANVDAAALAEAAAIERTTTKTQITHRGGLNAVVSYQGEIKEPVETFKTAVTTTELSEHLNDVLARIVGAGYRPLIIIDDTDRFARLGSDGQPQTASIHNLLTNAVQVLCEIQPPLDVVVAVHPRYEDVAAYGELKARYGFTVLETPRLPVDTDREPPPLFDILERRLRRAAIETPIEELVDRGALMALEAVYVERKQNLRDVLRVAQAACLVAAGAGARLLLAQHVFTALEQNPPTA